MQAQAQSRQDEFEVLPIELFFDLVFVFAVTQLSRHLLSHLTWRGIAETLVMLLPVFAVWSYTSWAATLRGFERRDTRVMLLAVMLFGLFMNASVTSAFSGSGWSFVVPLLLIQLVRTSWSYATARVSVLRYHLFWILMWLIATSPLWIAGAAANPDKRLLWWAAAAAIDLLGNWLGHPAPGRWLRTEDVSFAAGHMAERCLLLLIVALGETVLTTGTAMAGAPVSAMTGLTGAVALAATVALWALAFGSASRLISESLELTRDPYHASRHAVDALTIMVAGLVALAVAGEVVIAHPFESSSILVVALLCGGPVLYLLAHGWYLWFMPRVRPQLRLIGSFVLLVVGAGAVALSVPLYVTLILVALTLVVMAVLDARCAAACM